MTELYAAHGVQFRYPAEWEVSEEHEEGQLSITVASPNTSFWTLTLLADCPEPGDIVEAALDAFREEYEEIDVYPSTAQVCQMPTVARDIDFVCLELVNVARIRAFETDEFTAMVLYQGTDQEFADTGPILERITASLTCDAQPRAAIEDAGDDIGQLE